METDLNQKLYHDLAYANRISVNSHNFALKSDRDTIFDFQFEKFSGKQVSTKLNKLL